jgi:HEAT repeat protein
VGDHIQQLRTGELASRICAAVKLGEIGSPEAIAALQTALRDSTAEVAREAALALGKTRQAAAAGALAAVLENADAFFHGIVRTAAAESLGQLGQRQSIAALALGVRDPLAEPSRAAIRALGLLAREEAVPVLLAVVANADNYFLPSVRLAAVEVLGTLPVPAAREGLRQLLDNPNEEIEIVQAAKRSLA